MTIHPEITHRLAAEHLERLLAEGTHARLARAGHRRRRSAGCLFPSRLLADDRRTETQTIECGASRDDVVGVLAEPTRIPEWAPAFADRVTGDAQHGWHAAQGSRDFALYVAVDEGAGTVDYLREVAPGTQGGAYLRAVPRPGGGSVIGMTLPLVPGVDPAETASRLARELEALVAVVMS